MTLEKQLHDIRYKLDNMDFSDNYELVCRLYEMLI